MRRLWGQAYVAPVYALLLHRWLLTHRDAGLRRHRTKHVHVLAIGAQQLFWADVHSDAVRFQPLFGWLAGAVALDPRRAALDALPLQCRAGLLAVVAAFLPYYATSPRAFAAALAAMPSPRTLAPPPRGCPHAGGVDLVLTEAADMLGLLKSESSILVWLRSLRGAAARPALLSSRRGGASRAARLRLQSSLHALTARGGPRYLAQREGGGVRRARRPVPCRSGAAKARGRARGRLGEGRGAVGVDGRRGGAGRGKRRRVLEPRRRERRRRRAARLAARLQEEGRGSGRRSNASKRRGSRGDAHCGARRLCREGEEAVDGGGEGEGAVSKERERGFSFVFFL